MGHQNMEQLGVSLVSVKQTQWLAQKGGGGGTLIFFCIRRLGPSIYPSPPKITGISSTQKTFEILATQKIITILYHDLRNRP